MNLVPLTRKNRRLAIMKGKFTKNLFSLQLQLRTMLEEAGGDEAMELLDTLCKLNKGEQRVILKVLNRLVDDVLNKGPRFETEGDLALKRFEDDLYGDLLRAMKDESSSVKRSKLHVVDGGKRRVPKSVKELVDLQEFRRSRSKTSKEDTLLN